MNPFDLDQNDLIAYHLQELPLRQQRALHRIIQNNAAVAAESEAIAATLRAFPKNEAALPLDAAALERHWLALRPSLVVHFPKPFARRSLLLKWTLPTLAGFAFATTALLFSLHHYRHAQPSTVASVETRSSTIPTLSPSTGPNSALSSGVQPNAFTPRSQTVNRTWSPSSAPFEAETAKASPPIFPIESPVPLTPAKPSSATTSMASTESTISLPSNAARAQPPVRPSTQSIRPGTSPRISVPHGFPPTELTLGIFGDIAASRRFTYTSGTGASAVTESLSQTAAPAVGVLASFRQQLRPWLGYRVTATYASPSFESTRMNIYEFSGTYVVQGPHRGRFTSSIEAGAGLLDILTDPDSPTTDSRTFRGDAVIGIGSELALTRHWGLRAEYRAQLYKSPPLYSTNLTAGSPTPSGSFTFSSNPIVGVTYRFGAKDTD